MVAFTPKGGCPLKLACRWLGDAADFVAFTPKGGCPLKLVAIPKIARRWRRVAFTPKGGCPLKLERCIVHLLFPPNGSIHPQGWVPIETVGCSVRVGTGSGSVAFTPKGGCPLKPKSQRAFVRNRADE